MIPDARDHSRRRERAFAVRGPARADGVPRRACRGSLTPELRASWLAPAASEPARGPRCSARRRPAEEIFMAWHFARYTEAVAAAGKKEYPLPMFVNAALIRPGHQPGQYPSAGPLPHLIDVWRAGAPAIDFLAPDIYFPNFVEWARRYRASAATRCSFPRRCAAPRRRSTRSTRSARTTRSASRRSASSRSASRRRSMLARELRAGRPARAADPRASGQGHDGRAPVRGDRSSGSRSRCAWAATCSRCTFERGAPPSLADGCRPDRPARRPRRRRRAAS